VASRGKERGRSKIKTFFYQVIVASLFFFASLKFMFSCRINLKFCEQLLFTAMKNMLPPRLYKSPSKHLETGCLDSAGNLYIYIYKQSVTPMQIQHLHVFL